MGLRCQIIFVERQFWKIYELRTKGKGEKIMQAQFIETKGNFEKDQGNNDLSTLVYFTQKTFQGSMKAILAMKVVLRRK